MRWLMDKNALVFDNLSNLTVYSKYAKYLEKQQRRENWEEIVTRNKRMHLKKFPKLQKEIESIYELVYDKKILPSMRSLQFAGKPIDLSPARMFNCGYLPMDDPDAFSELMFLLLSGCGIGYSVQFHHIKYLPEIIKPKKTRRYLISDSIEGWADSVKVLMKAYFGSRNSMPLFDFSDIRPKGARLKTAGGIAPGPEPLKTCLHHIQTILDRKKDGERLKSIEIHDINCHIADAVRAGGIRRAAMIALFSFTDDDMLAAKAGAWHDANQQRGRANNTAVILRHKITEDDFNEFWEKIQKNRTGEPGFMFSNDQEWGLNPCAEISLRAFQFCNLVTINGQNIKNQADFNNRAEKASQLATLQASYTSFHYLREVWQETTEKEALIGVSISGIASGEVLELDMKEASQKVVDANAEIAGKIGVNVAARCTAIKPEGTASLVLGCSSGIHAWHNELYLRRAEIYNTEPLYWFLKEKYPWAIEDDLLDKNKGYIIYPLRAPKGAITRQETALQFLSRVERVYKYWVKTGHRKGHNVNNVSATVTIKPTEWERVGKWMWENRDNYTALAIMPFSDHTHSQTPFEDLTGEKYKEYLKKVVKIDLSQLKEKEDNTDLNGEIACAGNACEI